MGVCMTIKEIMKKAKAKGKTLTKEQAKHIQQTMAYDKRCRDLAYKAQLITNRGR